MSQKIHPSAIIEPGAEVAENVTIGAFCHIGPHVKIGKGNKISSHVLINGHTSIGEDNEIYAHCVLGTEPQDLSYAGEPTELIIGNKNILREFVSINRGTRKQDSKTIIGSSNMFMAYTHLGHDVCVGDNVRIVNSCNSGGHVTIGDGAIISGASNIGQFVAIGRGSFIGGGSAIDKDIPCFCTAYGNRIRLKGINIIGLKRMGIEKIHISESVDFYRSMEASTLSPRSFVESKEVIEEYQGNKIVEEIMEFIRQSRMGIPPFMS